MNQVKWATGWHGLEALTSGRNISLGIAVLFLSRVNGLLYLINAVEDEDLIERSRKKLVMNSITFLVFFLFFVVTLLFSAGFAVKDPDGEIVLEKFKYLQNLIQMPVVLLIFLGGVAGVLYGIGTSLFKGSRKGIWFTGTGSLLTVFALFLVAGFNNTAFYPSTYDLNSSLTIHKASSSQFTLKTMMIVSFMVPFVIGYIWYAWKAINNKRITEEELKREGHIY